MARLSGALGTMSLSSSTASLLSRSDSGFCDPTDLDRALRRLQRTLLHVDAERDRRIRTSRFERSKVESNLDYARTSLTTLEREALEIKAPGRRIEIQGDLNKKRELLDLLVDRLEDITKVVEDDDDDDAATLGDDDMLEEIIPTPSESMDSTSADAPKDDPVEEVIEPPEPTPTPPSAPPEYPTQTSQTLRSRGSAPSPSPSAHSTARSALFANRRKSSTALHSDEHASTATAEAILDHQRAEQDALSDSILKMAGALKASSQRFSSTLEADKEAVDKAGQGLEKTERGMEVARGRMGTLRKMTEGKGWWGRIMLYAWVYGLMVALILLVFVMPKLRF